MRSFIPALAFAAVIQANAYASTIYVVNELLPLDQGYGTGDHFAVDNC
jgi:hypothetical protein